MISKTQNPLVQALEFLLNDKSNLQEICKSNYCWDNIMSEKHIDC